MAAAIANQQSTAGMGADAVWHSQWEVALLGGTNLELHFTLIALPTMCGPVQRPEQPGSAILHDCCHPPPDRCTVQTSTSHIRATPLTMTF